MLASAVCKNGEVPLDILREANVQPLPNGIIIPSNYFIDNNGKAITYEFAYKASDGNVSEPFNKEFLEE